MTRGGVLIALVVIVVGCTSASAGPTASAATGQPTAAITGQPTPAATGQGGTGPTIACSLSVLECDEVLRAVMAVPALDVRGMPPLAVRIVDPSACRSVTGAPKGYDACGAPTIPGKAGATTGPAALATVVYRDGFGSALLFVWWWTYPSGRGPANAMLMAHDP